MKVTELMIGDWVYLYGDPIKINIDDLGVIDRDDTYDNGEHCRPIPLTAEILEKNGFIGKTAISGSSLYFYPLNDKVYWYKGGIYAIGENVWQDVYITSCEYVHQLQQTLRLVGIKKEIEL
jgi:hypothetical protein